MSKILVVDDNHLIRRTVRAILGSMQHEVLEAGTGLEGLALARSEKPDLILLDYMMPDLDGLELLRQAELEPELAMIPVVLLTAKAGVLDGMQFPPGRRVQQVLKPIKSSELLGLVELLVGPKSGAASGH